MDSPSRIYNDGDIHRLMSSPPSSYEGDTNDYSNLQELNLAELSHTSHTALCTEDLGSTDLMNLFKDDFRSSATSNLKVEFDEPRDAENGVKEVEMVQLVNNGKPPPYMRSIENIIVMKPLDRSKSNPGRIKFKLAKNSILSNSDDLQIFVRNFDQNFPIKGKFNQNSLKNICSCYNEHPNAIFCVRSKDHKINWSTNNNTITAHIGVQDIFKLDVQFAPIICESKFKKSDKILELVFQVEKSKQVFQQIYFMKCCALPSRDIKNFVEKLYKKNLVRKAVVIQAMETENVNLSYNLLKITYSPEDKEEVLETVRKLGGSFLSKTN